MIEGIRPYALYHEKASISHSKDLLASISHSSHASSKSHSHTVPRSPTHTISVHTVLVCTSTYSVLYVLLRIPYWMYLYVLNSTCTRTSSTYRSTYSTQGTRLRHHPRCRPAPLLQAPPHHRHLRSVGCAQRGVETLVILVLVQYGRATIENCIYLYCECDFDAALGT